MFGSGSGFPIDLVLFGMIAAFLVLRLRSILGKRTGYERPPQSYQPAPAPAAAPNGPVIEGRPDAVPTSSPARAVPDPASPTGQALTRMRNIDQSFEPAGFVNGAENAFRMIVVAFAAGDHGTLHNLLSPDTYRSFEAAIAARQAAGETQKAEIRAIDAATIEAASLLNTLASITVRFVSDQVSATFDKEGKIVAGTESVTEINDIWTFERDLASTDPTWRLVAARSA